MRSLDSRSRGNSGWVPIGLQRQIACPARSQTGIIRGMVTETETVMLWRPTGPEDLALVEASAWREWPPRLRGQPIFYPVLNEEYATMIARDWNVKHSGAAYVTRFQ